MLVLLALALFPVMAHAENAGEAVYETAIPSAKNNPSSGSHPVNHKSPNTGQSESGRATGSDAGGVGSEGSEKKSGSEGNGSKEGSSQEGEKNPSMAAGGGNGNKPNGGAGQSEGGISEAHKIGGSTSPAKAHGSGGSSPVVPILIAVVVLAAISIGVVLYRQRKSGQGGSGGRVSSSNAS
jgi:cobalamin biosynthesis Mg chelatase CobN